MSRAMPKSAILTTRSGPFIVSRQFLEIMMTLAPVDPPDQMEENECTQTGIIISGAEMYEYNSSELGILGREGQP